MRKDRLIIMGDGTHLDLSRRKVITRLLEDNKTAKDIGMIIGLDPTNVSREVRKRRTKKDIASLNKTICKDCKHRFGCNVRYQCGRNKRECKWRCLDCGAMKECHSYEQFTCKKLERFPFVCNGCHQKDNCPLDKWFYNPATAEKNYRLTLINSRSGIDQTPDDFEKINNALIEGVEKGQSVYHIANTVDVNVSVSTLYRYIHNEYVTVTIHDLPKVVALKRRKKKISSEYEYPENKGMDRTGHLYKDWIIYQIKNRIITFWEMDFLGVPHNSSKMLLVLTIPQISFMLLYPLERPNNQTVVEVINRLEKDLGTDDFTKLFPAIVTDRDSRFTDVHGFEWNDELGYKRTALFYCDAHISNQKPNVENINGQLRLFIDKKADISNMTQEQAYELASHLNSRILESLGASTPVDAFIEIFGEDILTKLHLRKIDKKAVAPKKVLK